MKIKLLFVAIALVAITTAFANKKYSYCCYRIYADVGTRYQVDPTCRQEGTGSGEYYCNSGSALCVVCTDGNTAYTDGSGNWYVDKSGPYVVVTYGEYVQY